DGLARVDADPVHALLDALESLVDLADGVAGLSRQGEVALPLHGEGVTLTGLLVDLDVAGLAGGGELVGLLLQRLGLLQVAGPLLLQRLLLLLDEGGGDAGLVAAGCVVSSWLRAT